MSALPAWYLNDTERYHLEHDGDVAVIRYGVASYAATKWRSDCAFCAGQAGESSFFPDHQEREWCRSGSRPHCTCDSCF